MYTSKAVKYWCKTDSKTKSVFNLTSYIMKKWGFVCLLGFLCWSQEAPVVFHQNTSSEFDKQKYGDSDLLVVSKSSLLDFYRKILGTTYLKLSWACEEERIPLFCLIIMCSYNSSCYFTERRSSPKDSVWMWLLLISQDTNHINGKLWLCQWL